MGAEVAALSAAAPAASAAATIGGSLVNTVGNYLLARQQHIWNRQDAEWTNQKNIEFWKMQNEYNTPAAQKQRMIEAGMNPLFYGLDGNSAGDLSATQPLAYQRAEMPNMANPVQSALDAALRIAQAENVKADTALKSNQTLTEEQRRENLIKEREEMDARIQKWIASAKLDDKSREKIEKYQEYADELYQAQIDRDSNAAALDASLKQQIDELLPGQKELQKMSLQDFRNKWKYWNAQIDHLAKQDAVLAKQAKYYLLGQLSSGVMGSGLSIVNGYILDLIDNDSDLSPQERTVLGQIFNPSQKKGKKKGWAAWNDISDLNGPLYDYYQQQYRHNSIVD